MATALRETESPTYQAYEQARRDRVDTVEALDGAAWEPDPLLDHRYQSGVGREVGSDGLDDVRIPREDGPALGSLDAGAGRAHPGTRSGRARSTRRIRRRWTG